MTEIYTLSNNAFLKQIFFGGLLLILGLFGFTQVPSDAGAIYYASILSVFGLLVLGFSISQRKKRLLEISSKGIVINNNIKLYWKSIQFIKLRMVRIKNKEIPMIDVYMNKTWDSSHLTKKVLAIADMNQQTGFGQFTILAHQLSINENDLHDRLSTLLKLDEDNREQYLSHNKYR